MTCIEPFTTGSATSTASANWRSTTSPAGSARFLSLSPDHVYLHAGTRKGAQALGLQGATVHKNDLPPEFRRLSPAEIEDCLCIYKARIQRLAAAART